MMNGSDRKAHREQVALQLAAGYLGGHHGAQAFADIHEHVWPTTNITKPDLRSLLRRSQAIVSDGQLYPSTCYQMGPSDADGDADADADGDADGDAAEIPANSADGDADADADAAARRAAAPVAGGSGDDDDGLGYGSGVDGDSEDQLQDALEAEDQQIQLEQYGERLVALVAKSETVMNFSGPYEWELPNRYGALCNYRFPSAVFDIPSYPFAPIFYSKADVMAEFGGSRELVHLAKYSMTYNEQPDPAQHGLFPLTIVQFLRLEKFAEVYFLYLEEPRVRPLLQSGEVDGFPDGLYIGRVYWLDRVRAAGLCGEGHVLVG
jgi:hypothetical protein